MNKIQNPASRNKGIFIAAIIVMLGVAFFQCFITTHDLQWAYDKDFDRDMAFIRGNLEGNFGKDPNYIGEYLWYNPLLFSIESVIVKWTGLPINIIVTRAGVYLNLLSPIAFVLMLWVLFDPKIALSGLLSFLFLASGNIHSWGAATYSPWLYPVCFVQFLFYLNIIFLFLALSTQRYLWFIMLGAFTGISFMGHLGPTVIILLISVIMLGAGFFRACKAQDLTRIKKYFLQALAILIPCLIAASPLLFIVAGKYQLRYVNRSPSDYIDDFYKFRYFGGMIRANFSISLLISFLGFWWFYKKFHQPIIRKIILNWFLVCIVMYLYSSIIPILHDQFRISLPGTVPSFHYFFYLKAIQSVFFAFGLVFLLKKPVLWISARMKQRGSGIPEFKRENWIFVGVVLLCVALYYPFYQSRRDFVKLREWALMKAAQKEKIEVYNYIVDHIPSDRVILCEEEMSTFPVMASARKMVSNYSTFSNPFVNYDQREKDRGDMLSFLITGLPASAANLFPHYKVSYILLSLPKAEKAIKGKGLPGKEIFKNNTYLILSIADYTCSYTSDRDAKLFIDGIIGH